MLQQQKMKKKKKLKQNNKNDAKNLFIKILKCKRNKKQLFIIGERQVSKGKHNKWKKYKE